MAVFIKSRNLLPYPYDVTTKTENGVTFTDNGDGTITLNGTATGTAVFELYVDRKSLGFCSPGKTYTVSMEGNQRDVIYINSNRSTNGTTWGEAIFNTNVTGDKKTVTIPDDTVGVQVYVVVTKNAKNLNNYVVKPMINEGDIALPFESCGAVKVNPYIKSRNLISTNDIKECYRAIPTILSSGTVKAQHQANESVGYVSFIPYLKAGTYTLSYLYSSENTPVDLSGTMNMTYCGKARSATSTGVPTDGWEKIFSNGKRDMIDEKKTFSFTVKEDCYYLISFYLQVNGDKDTKGDFTITIKDLMLNEGSEALPYEPYGAVKVKAYLKSRNLFDVSRVNTRAGEVTNNGDGTITIYKYLSGNGNKLKDLCPTLKAGEEATLSFVTGGSNFVAFWSSDLGSFTWSNGKTYVISENLLNAYIYFYTLESDRETPVIMKDIMMNYGSAIPYEPYLLEV